jgi:hypothetical protein
MAGYFYTTDDLIDEIKRLSFVPNVNSGLQDVDYIAILNDELVLRLTNEIMKVRQNFFLKKTTQTMSALVPNYALPRRAIGNVLKTIYMFYPPNQRSEVKYRDIDILEGQDLIVGTGEPLHFFMYGDDYMLVPTPSSSGTLELWFFQALSKLVAVSSCAQVTGVSTVGGTTTFTVDTDLTASLSTGDTIDFQSLNSPFKLTAQDVAITSISSTQIAVAATDVQNEAGTVKPQVDDYICPAFESCIPQVPREFHAVLAQMAVLTILQPLSHTEKYALAKDRLKEMKDAAFNLIANRVESQPEILVDSGGFNAFIGGGWPPTDIILK